MSPTDAISSYNSMADTGNATSLAPVVHAPSARPGGLKGFLINNLPGIAGGIGAVGGELLDPFGGGAVTGAAASAAGEALKEKLLGQKINPGQMAIQAVETGALGGLGKGIGLARNAAKTALSTGAEEAAGNAVTQEAAQATPTLTQKVGNFLKGEGQKIEARTGGFAPGQKVAGQALDTASSQRIAQTLANENVHGLSSPALLKSVEDRLNSLGQAHGAITEASNVAINPDEKQALLSELNDRLTNPNNAKFQAGGSSTTVQKYAQTYANELGKANDLQALGKYKTGLDKNEINYNSSTDAATNARNIAAKTTRSVINDFMSEKIPSLAAVNDRMSALHDAKAALTGAAGKLANLTTGGEGLWGRILSGETAEKGKAVLGKTLQAAGNTLAGNPSTEEALATATKAGAKPTMSQRVSDIAANAQQAIANPKAGAKAVTQGVLNRTINPLLAKPGKSIASVGKQLAGRAVGNVVMNGVPNQPANPNAFTPASQYGTSGLNTSAGGNAATSGATSGSVYPEENMLYDIERDPKHASTYEALYKSVNPTPSATSLDNLTTNQKNQLTGSQNAISALNGYMEQIQQLASGASGPVAGRIGSFLGKYGLGGQSAANAYALDTSAADVATQIAAGLTPTGKPQQGLINQVKESLPKISDSSQAAQAKVSQLVARLQAVMQTEATPIASYVSTPGEQSTLDPTQLATLLGQQ